MNLRSLLFLITAFFLAFSAHATNKKAAVKEVNITSGKAKIIHVSKFRGPISAGLKEASVFMKQPKHGKLTFKKKVDRSNPKIETTFFFTYTPDGNFIGTDKTETGVEIFKRLSSGKIISIPYSKIIVLNVVAPKIKSDDSKNADKKIEPLDLNPVATAR